ncbi:hypothetical protein D3C87_455920 [compost metagenome]
MTALRRCLLLPLLLAAATAHADAVRCLTGGDGDRIHLAWTLPGAGADGGRVSYVRYAGKTRWLRLTLLSQESSVLAEDRPWQFDTVWAEHVDGKVNGQYAVTTQGARIYGVHYTPARGGRATAFHEDISAMTGSGCHWD